MFLLRILVSLVIIGIGILLFMVFTYLGVLLFNEIKDEINNSRKR